MSLFGLGRFASLDIVLYIHCLTIASSRSHEIVGVVSLPFSPAAEELEAGGASVMWSRTSNTVQWIVNNSTNDVYCPFWSSSLIGMKFWILCTVRAG